MGNYSYKTSLPAYKSGNKDVQATLVLNSAKSGAKSLLEISEAIKLPQSTVAGRVNELIDSKQLIYNGFVVYKNRKRKKISVI